MFLNSSRPKVRHRHQRQATGVVQPPTSTRPWWSPALFLEPTELVENLDDEDTVGDRDGEYGELDLIINNG